MHFAASGTFAFFLSASVLFSAPTVFGREIGADQPGEVIVPGSEVSGSQLPAGAGNHGRLAKTETSGATDYAGLPSRIAEAGIRPGRRGSATINLSFELESLGDIAESLPPVGPVSLTGELAFTHEGYTLSSMVAKIGDTELTGDITVSLTGSRPALTARLQSNRVDLTRYFPEEDEEERETEKLFPSDPLPFDNLKTLDVDLTYSATGVIFPDIVFDNFLLTAKLVDGQLDIHSLSANVANGKLALTGGMNVNQEIPLFKVNLDVKALEPGLLPDFQEINATEASLTDINLDATGSGRSVAEIMGSLNGKFLSITGEGTHRVKQIDRLGSDFMLQTLNLLNPFRKTVNETQIMCAIIKFDVKDGIATSDKGLAVQTQNLNIIGGGIVNLGTEELDIIFHPEARGGISISKVSLVELVRIDGTLANPEVKEDTRNALLKGIGTAGAVFITGGLSYLVQGLFAKFSEKDSPCDLALRGPDPATDQQNAEQPNIIGN